MAQITQYDRLARIEKRLANQERSLEEIIGFLKKLYELFSGYELQNGRWVFLDKQDEGEER
jgi:hypothetical protein